MSFVFFKSGNCLNSPQQNPSGSLLMMEETEEEDDSSDSKDDESLDNETEEEKHERETNELDVVGDYKSQSTISVEFVPEVVDIKTLTGRKWVK